MVVYVDGAAALKEGRWKEKERKRQRWKLLILCDSFEPTNLCLGGRGGMTSSPAEPIDWDLMREREDKT